MDYIQSDNMYYSDSEYCQSCKKYKVSVVGGGICYECELECSCKECGKFIELKTLEDLCVKCNKKKLQKGEGVNRIKMNKKH